MSDFQPVKDNTIGSLHPTPYSLAAGLLAHDFGLATSLAVVICGISFIMGLYTPDTTPAMLAALILERGVQIIAMFIIVRRWRKKLEVRAGASAFTTFIRTGLVGYLIWGCSLVPFFLLSRSDNQSLVFASAILLTFSALLALRYFFYFATIGLFNGSPKELATQTRVITLRSPFAPMKAISAPLAITAVCMALAFIPYPDGRSVVFNSLAGSLEGLFTILSTYTGLAFTLLLADDTSWRTSGLDHYRQERLETLSIAAPRFASGILSAQGSIKVFILAAFIFSLNISRQVSTAPAAQIKLLSVVAGNKRVHIELEVSDKEFQLVGFRPAAFSIAGENGTPVASKITAISINNQSSDAPPLITPTTGRVKIGIDFESTRSAHDFASLEDLYLWYYTVKLQPIPPSEIRKDLTTDEPSPSSSSEDSPHAPPSTSEVPQGTTI
jgi:hypothetical protein